MKIIVVYASARKNGYSTKAANIAADYFEKSGDEVKRYYLHKMDLHACKGCFVCRRIEGCVQKVI